MRINEIKKMAKAMGVRTDRMKKADVIRAVQRAENNIDCYGTQRVEYCKENGCLWRSDCQKANGAPG